MRKVPDERVAEQVKQIAQEAANQLSKLVEIARASRRPANIAAECLGAIRQMQGELARIGAEFEKLARSDAADVQL